MINFKLEVTENETVTIYKYIHVFTKSQFKTYSIQITSDKT
jgi:hypothetical protein